MKENTTILISLVVLLFSLTIPGKTQEKSDTKRFSLIPFVGSHTGYEFGKLIPLPNTSDVPDITVLSKSKGARIGFSLGYQITKHVEVQGTFIYGLSEFQEDVGIGLAGIPFGITKVSDTKSFSYSGNILYSVPIQSLSVYVTGGGGAMTLKPDVLVTKTTLLLNYGAGLKMNPAKHLRLFFDVRDQREIENELALD